jgi:hypothetical protein
MSIMMCIQEKDNQNHMVEYTFEDLYIDEYCTKAAYFIATYFYRPALVQIVGTSFDIEDKMYDRINEILTEILKVGQLSI